MAAREDTFRIAVRKFDPFESAIRRQWESFQSVSETPLTLEVEPLDLHPLYEQTLENNGLKRGDWDVAFLSSDWFAMAHDSGAVVDLTPLIAAHPPEGYPNGWTHSLLELQRFDDVTIGLPYHDGPECLVYRRDLFDDSAEQAAYQERFGRPLRPPREWSEFLDVARFFHRPDQGLYGTVFAAYPDGHNTVYDFCLQLWTRGGELFDASGAIMLESEAAVHALRFYRDVLNDTTAMHPRAREMDSVKAGLAFAAGEIALMINWFGFAAMAETAPASQTRGQVDLAAVPGSGEAGISLNSYWILAIGAGSPHRACAYDFLRWCASAEMDKLLTIEGGIGCRWSTWTDPEVNAAIPFYYRLPSLHTGARELPRRRDWAELAATIDAVVLTTIDTDRPIEDILAEYQARQIASRLGDDTGSPTNVLGTALNHGQARG